MRSPWQLIKNLTSRRKTEEAHDAVDTVVQTDGPLGQKAAKDSAAQPASDVAPEPIPTFPAENNEPVEQPNPPVAERGEPASSPRENVLHPDSISEEAPDSPDQSLVTPVDQAIEPEPNLSAPVSDRMERPANAGQAPIGATKSTVLKKATQRREVKKTPLEEAIELDHEINALRLTLSAKLLEQNRQLRDLLERYNER